MDFEQTHPWGRPVIRLRDGGVLCPYTAQRPCPMNHRGDLVWVLYQGQPTELAWCFDSRMHPEANPSSPIIEVDRCEPP